ncbi:MAG TPA: rRNA maturation RNase YbeY [Patescibacteria group bacterium]|nr:rRNA maturation RNase YbeY [Patescibacteria group bacterium]
MVKVEVNYLVKTPQKYEALFGEIACLVARELKLNQLEVSVALVSGPAMRKLNNRHRGKDSITDVLSFEEVNEVIICFSRARKQARENRQTVREEVAFLFLHGLLHLLRFDHKAKSQKIKMFGLSQKILDRL